VYVAREAMGEREEENMEMHMDARNQIKHHQSTNNKQHRLYLITKREETIKRTNKQIKKSFFGGETRDAWTNHRSYIKHEPGDNQLILKGD